MELINCNYDLHYWNFDTDFHLLETDWTNDLFSSAFFDFVGFKELILQQLSEGNHYPLVLEAEANLLWIAGFQFENGILNNIHMIGPIFSGRDTYLLLRKKLDSYELSVSLRASMHKVFESIPTVPSNILMQYAVMLHYCLNEERISVNDVTFLNSTTSEQMDSVSLSGNSHAGIWINEQLLCKMLADGDPRYKEALQKSFSLSHGVKADIGDALRYHKNNCLVLLTLCSRACISGGLSPDIGYDLNDYYAQKIEYCKSMTDANKLCAEMLEDYVSRVQEVKKNPSVSNLMRNSCEYIKSHLGEPISIEELAKRTGYTEYYFSHKFKKEIGCSVNDYILNEKIERAKLLLSGTTESIQSISDNLAFSNRSYFYTCFQKITGMSPTEYRKTYGK
ncbi:MAG: AraC family transcriptional regulator [Clostridiales bacterium]|nr:AraC family transcriptional regulator [Roseburia sp.]MDD7636813.1 AraC family transcriptional regulator [Clostridiales bacterium]MDY4113107.1 AraC family transcriptional regulator [Roseburia sp.]